MSLIAKVITDKNFKISDQEVKYAFAAIFRGEKFLLVRRSKEEETRPQEWEFPGGHREKSETIEEAAKREVLEEVGLDISLEKRRVYFKTPEGDYGVIIKAQSKDKNFKLNSEHDKGVWITLDKIDNFSPLPKDFKKEVYMLHNNLKVNQKKKATKDPESVIKETQAVFTSIENPAWEALWKLNNLKKPDYDNFHLDEEVSDLKQVSYGKNKGPDLDIEENVYDLMVEGLRS